MESYGESWIVISWSLPHGEVQITDHVILISEEVSERNITLENNGTSVNVTGLQAGTQYSFRVIAVASDGQTGLPSAVLTATTDHSMFIKPQCKNNTVMHTWYQ